MPVAESEQLADRYALQLSDDWQVWFDEDCRRGLLNGQYHVPVDLGELIETAPHDVWPGFMLADTLPLVSNDYGDWWCFRVGSDNRIVEIVQWLHGGGDYLPVGKSIHEAVLWDRLQTWRAGATGAQPPSHEYPTREGANSSIVGWTPDRELELDDWLARGLGVERSEICDLVGKAKSGCYPQVLTHLLDRDWSSPAAACELIEVALQGSLTLLADSQLARRCGINWAPEYTSWLFDTDRIPEEARRLVRDQCPAVEFHQDWELAGRWARWMTTQRTDLSWAGDVAGWAAQRSGDRQRAIEYFFANRYASAFTDQSVRLRSHWFAERFGKFSIAQLDRMADELSESQRSDPYLQLLRREPVHRLRSAVRDFWLTEARGAMQERRYADAYTGFTQAGWDLGADRLSDYVEILDGLEASSQAAGWTARARLAAAHAECLRRRLPSLR